MPPESAIGSPQNWLDRARSNLSLAKVSKPDDCLWEDLCFHAQQAVEKALKALLISQGIPFRFVHDINELLLPLQERGIRLPEPLTEAVTLTGFAVMTRYPGTYEPVTEEEYQQAVRLAEAVLEWVDNIVRSPCEGEHDDDGNPTRDSR